MERTGNRLNDIGRGREPPRIAEYNRKVEYFVEVGEKLEQHTPLERERKRRETIRSQTKDKRYDLGG